MNAEEKSPLEDYKTKLKFFRHQQAGYVEARRAFDEAKANLEKKSQNRSISLRWLREARQALTEEDVSELQKNE